jgi:hypothetical protein
MTNISQIMYSISLATAPNRLLVLAVMFAWTRISRLDHLNTMFFGHEVLLAEKFLQNVLFDNFAIPE